MKNNILKILPELTFNTNFVEEFVRDTQPFSATLGVVEEMKKDVGFIAIHPGIKIPEEALSRGFNFGQGLVGNKIRESRLVHFVFDFYDFQKFSIVLNPSNKIVKHVLSLMRKNKDYFFFVFNGLSMTAFRGEPDSNNDWFDENGNLEFEYHLAMSDEDYEVELQLLKEEDRYLRESLLSWVCRENLDFINPDENRFQVGGRA